MTATQSIPSHAPAPANGHFKATPSLPHSHHSFSTRALHIGSEPSLSASAAVIPSIDLSTTYSQSSVGVHKGFEYTRSANPTRLALERVLASLEGADTRLEENLVKEGKKDGWEGGPAALAFSSGSAATATIVGALGGRGGHILSVADVYGGTSRYMVQVASVQQGVETTFVDMSYANSEEGDIKAGETEEETRKREDEEIVDRVEKAIRPDTKLIWIETPTNPMLNLVPIALIATVAKKHNIVLCIDNTFASPYWQNPLSQGADIVVHSITKYLNGHSDVCGGVIITPNPTLLAQFRFLQNAHGAIPSPFDSWLVIRGLKTLSLRAKQHGLNGLLLAKWLETTGKANGWVRDVRYPGLKRSTETRKEIRERELSWDQMSEEGRKWCEKNGYTKDGEKGFPFGGMISFHIASSSPHSQTDSSTAETFLENLNIFALAESLGGVESLAELPMKMTHGGVDPNRRTELGIDGELIRLSVGVEEGDDLLEDLENALRVAVAKK